MSTAEVQAPRVPTHSLPMVVPPQEPDQAPDLSSPGSCEHYSPASLLHLSNHLEGNLPQDNEKAASKKPSVCLNSSLSVA